MGKAYEFRRKQPLAPPARASIAQQQPGGFEPVPRKQMVVHRGVKTRGHGQSGDTHAETSDRSWFTINSICVTRLSLPGAQR